MPPRLLINAPSSWACGLQRAANRSALDHLLLVRARLGQTSQRGREGPSHNVKDDKLRTHGATVPVSTMIEMARAPREDVARLCGAIANL